MIDCPKMRERERASAHACERVSERDRDEAVWLPSLTPWRTVCDAEKEGGREGERESESARERESLTLDRQAGRD